MRVFSSLKPTLLLCCSPLALSFARMSACSFKKADEFLKLLSPKKLAVNTLKLENVFAMLITLHIQKTKRNKTTTTKSDKSNWQCVQKNDATGYIGMFWWQTWISNSHEQSKPDAWGSYIQESKTYHYQITLQTSNTERLLSLHHQKRRSLQSQTQNWTHLSATQDQALALDSATLVGAWVTNSVLPSPSVMG